MDIVQKIRDILPSGPPEAVVCILPGSFGRIREICREFGEYVDTIRSAFPSSHITIYTDGKAITFSENTNIKVLSSEKIVQEIKRSTYKIVLVLVPNLDKRSQARVVINEFIKKISNDGGCNVTSIECAV